jgi:Zn-dependent protease with chaperone function
VEQADFVHLVRVSEIDAQERPQAYRKHVVWFAALGYGYVALSLVLGCALMYLAIVLLGNRKFYPAIMCGIGGGTIAWVALRAMVVRSDPAQGLDITADQAPQLFKILAKLRKKLGAPPIHRVIITDDYNAFITQQPRFGVLGPAHNTLGLGLPMLVSLSPERLVSVLAHEYAHLRGGDGKLAAWLYRCRIAWSRLADHAFDNSGEGDAFAAVTRGFVNWYAPRLSAKSFAMARQEEYTADRWAGKISGAEHAQAALLEISLLANHMQSGFWRQYWRLAATHPQPPQLPYAWLAAGQLRPPAAHDLQAALHEIKTEKTGHTNTHPSTRERVQALGGSVQIPGPSVKKASGLLGSALALATAHFDKTWWAAQRKNWQHLHQQALSDAAQISDMESKMRYLQLGQIERLARLMERSQPARDTLVLYQQLLNKDDQHPTALWRLGAHHAERGDMAALPYLQRAADSHSHLGWAASSTALQLLDRQTFDSNIGEIRKTWRASQDKFSKLEDLCAQELSEGNVLDHCSVHRLSSDELADLQTSASLQSEIGRIWLLERKLKTFPWRKRYVAIVSVASRQQKEAVNWQEVEARLDLPGRVTCLDERWLDDIMPAKQRPALGNPVYPASVS